jgi:hypothetical protein
MASYQAKTHRVYYPKISYDYQVAGSNYMSQHFAFGETSGSSDEIQLTLDYYRVGEIVRVHYSPAHPELAVLDTGIQGGSWVALIVGALFVTAGGLLAYLIFVNHMKTGKFGRPAPVPQLQV